MLCACYDELVEAEAAGHEGDPDKKLDDIKTFRHVTPLRAIWDRLSPVGHHVPIDASLAGCMLRIVARSPEVAVMVRSYAQALVSEAWNLVLFAVIFDDRETRRSGVPWDEGAYYRADFEFTEMAARIDEVVDLIGEAAGSPDVAHAIAHLTGAANALRALDRVGPEPDEPEFLDVDDRLSGADWSKECEAQKFEQLLNRVRLAKPIFEHFVPLEHLLAGNLLLEVPEFDAPDEDEDADGDEEL